MGLPILLDGNGFGTGLAADLVRMVSDHSVAVLVGFIAGIAAAVVLRIISRVRRLLVSAIVLAVAGGAGTGGVSALMQTVANWR